jgi:ribonuclease BN (tRNA processing enzyme)
LNELTRITFTGTGSGKAALNRFHSSFVIDHSGFRLLVDAGDSVSRALLKSEIDFNSIDGIILSHFHPDHICGLPSLLIQMKMNKRKSPLKIFLHNTLFEDLRRLLVKTYVIPDRLNFDLEFIKYEFESEFIIQDDFKIRAVQNSHLDKYEYFVKSEKISLASSSFIFSLSGKKIFYTGDLGDENDLNLLDEVKIDVFISETTHIEPVQIVKTAEDYKSAIVVFTHISEEAEKNIASFVQNHTGKPAILTAFDGMELVI